MRPVTRQPLKLVLFGSSDLNFEHFYLGGQQAYQPYQHANTNQPKRVTEGEGTNGTMVAHDKQRQKKDEGLKLHFKLG